MTASELYEIVKDVPRAAWPAKTDLVGRLWHCDTLPVPLANIINMFVGSMTAWLLRTYNRVETQSTPWGSVECTTCHEESRKEASSLVAALAAACKEAA